MGATPRRRQPEIVRAALLDAVVQEAVHAGLGSVTVLAVAARAGVSKGALFHHFSSKQDLVEATLTSLIADFEDRVREVLRQSPPRHGGFSRAYVQVNFDHLLQQEQINDIGLTMGNMLEPALLVHWRTWMRGMLVR